MVHMDGGDHASSQLWSVAGPCAYGGAPLIGGRGMAMDGHTVKAVGPQRVCRLGSFKVEAAARGSSWHGFAPLGSSCQPALRPFHAVWEDVASPRIESALAAKQTSLLYLSLTRCRAALVLRTIGPCGTTIALVPSAPHRGDPRVRGRECGIPHERLQQSLGLPFSFHRHTGVAASVDRAA
jgi:hypothetical protein